MALVVKLKNTKTIYGLRAEMTNTVSIVTAILNSHEVVKRQLLHYNKLNLPDSVEVVYVDDGSDPPLAPDVKTNFKFTLLATNNKKEWTQPAARNLGAKNATGDYLILTDIDHIVQQGLIDVAGNCKFDVVRFRREVAVIDENGDFTQDWDVIKSYGFIKNRLKIAPHGNSYIMRKDLYLGLGGVDETYVGTGKYPNREEVPLKRKLKILREQGKITIWDDETKPTIYMIPNGHYCGDKDYNPFGLFHTLTRSIRASRKRQRQYGLIGNHTGKE
ncbi:MAG: glycosyltransferase [Magnetococcus sp. WYHC-3]